MILNVGLRTDIVHHYHEWLFNRFSEGIVYARNPLFERRINIYELTPEKIDAVIFCSKNYRPVLEKIDRITSHYRTYFFYTVTGYEEDLEPSSPPIRERIETLKELSKIVGKEKLVWRYDPVLLTKKYTAEHHMETFAALSGEIAPFVSCAVFSFVEMFIKIGQRIPDVEVMNKTQKHEIAKGLGAIAQKNRLPLQICCAETGYEEYGIKRTGCVTLEALGRANKCSFRSMPHLGNKAGCQCIVSRDIGWYDSCPSGCKYCNANRGIENVRDNFLRHDPASPLLIGHVHKNDQLMHGIQNSFLLHNGRQMSLFDL